MARRKAGGRENEHRTSVLAMLRRDESDAQHRTSKRKEGPPALSPDPSSVLIRVIGGLNLFFLGFSWASRCAGEFRDSRSGRGALRVVSMPASADSGLRSVFQIKNRKSSVINRQSIRISRVGATWLGFSWASRFAGGLKIRAP
jgi:hypothetical protein